MAEIHREYLTVAQLFTLKNSYSFHPNLIEYRIQVNVFNSE